MEFLLQNIDLILTSAVIIVTAVVLARQGQISLLRELLLSLRDIDGTTLYQTLPTATRLLVSSKTVETICARCGKANCTDFHES